MTAKALTIRDPDEGDQRHRLFDPIDIAGQGGIKKVAAGHTDYGQ